MATNGRYFRRRHVERYQLANEKLLLPHGVALEGNVEAQIVADPRPPNRSEYRTMIRAPITDGVFDYSYRIRDAAEVFDRSFMSALSSQSATKNEAMEDLAASASTR